MGKKTIPTLKQIAELTGFSQSSISMILNRRKDVSFSDETVRVVLSAAESLGYDRKIAQAGSQRLFGEGIVAVLCPNISNPYYSTLVQAIEQSAWDKGFQVVTLNTYRSPEVEARNLELLGKAGVDGIIFTMRPLESAALERAVGKIPTVVIGDKGSSFNIDTVEMDNYSASVLVARHLIGLGHKRVAYISTTLDPGNAIRLQRLRGLEDTFGAECPEGSVTVRSRDVTPTEELGDLFIEHRVGFELTGECLSSGAETAFVAVNDMVAYGVIDAVTAAGYSVPSDYSVCGFDNVYPSRLSPISLTTVDNYIVDKGHYAFAMLASRMAGAKEGSKERGPDIITRVEYPPRLIVRGSTAVAVERKGTRR